MSTTTRGLFIPAAVLGLPKLTLTARLVLAEILNLHQVSGNVFARDTHFADRLNVGVRTVGTAIAELETQGYLARPYDPAARQKRSLVPTEKCLPIQQGVVADSATSVGECLPIQQPLPEKCLPIQQGVVADSADINNILNKRETVGAADAATPAPSLAESSPPALLPASHSARLTGKKPKPASATPEEVAELQPPYSSKPFAELWATFRAGPQHAKKALSAFQMMLSKLGKYPEGFAIVMLEAAIQGTWSGIENPGTARAFTEWQAAQGRAQPAPAASLPLAPALNEQVMAQREAQARERQRQHLARHSAPPTPPAAP